MINPARKFITDNIQFIRIVVVSFSLVSINLAGFVWIFPTSIRQLLDPDFFAGHFASLAISSAFAVLVGRLAFHGTSLLVRLFVLLGQCVVRTRTSSHDDAAYEQRLETEQRLESETRHSPTGSIDAEDAFSIMVGILFAFFTFAFSHFGPNASKVLTSIMIMSICFLFVALFAFAYWRSVVKPNFLIGVAIVVGLILSFAAGHLRMLYLLTQIPSVVTFVDGEENSFGEIRLVGSTSNGVILGEFQGSLLQVRKNLKFHFVPYSAIRSIERNHQAWF